MTIGGRRRVAFLEIFSTNLIRYTLEDRNTSWGGWTLL